MSNRRIFVSATDVALNALVGVPVTTLLGVYSIQNDVSESTLQIDGTFYVQQAINEARASLGANTQGAIVLFPPGVIRVSTLKWYEGVTLLGCGTKATELHQLSGVNAPMIQPDPAVYGTLSFFHHASILHMCLRKDGTTDTVGSAIQMNCRVGENCTFEHLLLQSWPESGIKLTRGGQPVRINNIHAFGCKEYGIDLARTGGDIWHMVSLDMISGDNHGKGLIHLDTAGAPMESFHLCNIKAECLTAGTMPCVIDLDRLNGAAVTISNVGFHAIQPGQTVIRIGSSGARILGGVVRAGNTPLLIDDIPATRQIIYDPARLDWRYDSGIGML